jgi:2,3-dihydroxy-p-cumate/2,3-dihydroxybenzoate 3,4-dioxygenase
LHSRPGATPFGLEVRYSEDLDAALERLRGLGVSAGRGSAEDCALRKVKDMIWLNDFSGNRVELVVRPLNSGWRYFPSRDAGIKGLADVILRSVDVEKDVSIWSGVFSARKSATGPATRLICVSTIAITGSPCSRPIGLGFSVSNTRSRT